MTRNDPSISYATSPDVIGLVSSASNADEIIPNRSENNDEDEKNISWAILSLTLIKMT